MVSLRWDGANQCWWWAERQSGRLQRWPRDAATNADTAASAASWTLPDEALPLAGCHSGQLLMSLPKRLCLGKPRRNAWDLTPLLAVDPAEPRTSVQQGCIDHLGQLVFGTRNDSPDARPIASFSQYSLRHGLRRLALPTVAVAASLCFSPDGVRLYFADGARPQIMQCDYDAATAGIANVRLFAATAGALPGPSVVDCEGMLWNLQQERAVRYRPDGSECESHPLRYPLRYPLRPHSPAALALGGVLLDELLIAWPGGRLQWRCATPGLPPALFDDTLPL